MIIRDLLWASPLGILPYVSAAQPSAAPPVAAPLRDLPWAQLNFLHTTDTHGWHAGHLQEPSFSADWGDYISLAERLNEKADNEGVDLLLIDTGDRIEGNGLYDASRPKGRYDLEIFSEQTVDVICSGNHELYKPASVEYEYNTTVPNYKGKYLASNLDIIDLETGEQRALAQRYKKFTTRNQGIRILAFGFLYDFTMGASNIVVQKVQDTIKEGWFQDAIRDREVDLFVVIGHVAVHSPEYTAIYTAIRSQQWDVPIQIFGGHTHIRDYVKYDNKAYALESGRYMETIGFMSINGLATGGKEKTSFLSSLFTNHIERVEAAVPSPTFSRRYIDNNLYSFYHHTALNSTTFSTPHGGNVSAMISSARKKLDLDQTYGCAPHDFWTNRAPFPSEDSIFTWLQDQVMPDMLKDDARGDVPRTVITNTGALRFDIFKGVFTTDTMYTVSPFTSGFRFIEDVPLSITKRLLQILNQEAPQLWPTEQSMALRSLAPAVQRASGLYADINALPYHTTPGQIPLAKQDPNENLTPGYTTRDDAGTDGDDTIHAPIKFYQVPNCFESRIGLPPASADEQEPVTVDLVYNSFIEPYVLVTLKFLGTDYEAKNTAPYMEGKSMTWIIGEWVREHWKCD
ncbi:MAG: hypothetical protein Q9217_005666 [Psora testacea]